jgi:hypothetical protein
MSHINIAKLFPNSSNNIIHSNGALDINTLTKQFNNEIMYNMDIAQLQRIKQSQQKHIQNSYIKLYNVCCNQIVSANSLNLTDIIFEVNDFLIDSPGYNPSDCIDFISDNLQKHSISCVKLYSNKLFITWHNASNI